MLLGTSHSRGLYRKYQLFSVLTSFLVLYTEWMVQECCIMVKCNVTYIPFKEKNIEMRISNLKNNCNLKIYRYSKLFIQEEIFVSASYSQSSQVSL